MTAVFSSGTFTVQANPVAGTSLGGVTIEAGANLDLYGATVMSGAILSVASGASVSNVAVSSGGRLGGGGDLGGYNNFVYGGIDGTTLVDGYLYVEAGGTTSGVAIGYDGFMAVGSRRRRQRDHRRTRRLRRPGRLDGGRRRAGRWSAVVRAASATPTKVYGSAMATAIFVGGAELVYSGGYAGGAVVSSGGQQHIYSGGVVSGAHILSGGTEILDAGASATAVTVSSGGEVELSLAVAAGASLTLQASPLSAVTSLSGVTIDAGGILVVTSAAVAGTGVLSLASGAAVQYLTVAAGGRVNGPGAITQGGEDYGVVSGVQIDFAGTYDEFEVESRGVASGVLVAQGQLVVEVGGSAVSTTLDEAGASDAVYGSAIYTIVRSGAEETVEGGGASIKTTVSAGGEQLVQSGGRTVETLVASGGLEVLSSGATASGVVVASGGEVTMFAVISSGTTFVLPASPLTVASATLDGVTVREGGALDLTWRDRLQRRDAVAGRGGGDRTGDRAGRRTSRRSG